jgi:protein ImuB
MFAAIYIPDFLLQSVTRANPALGAAAPLALLGGSPPLWSVVAADPAALAAGIQLGMTKAQVAQFGNVQICSRSESLEKSAHAALLDAAWSISPRVEDTAPDAVVLDLEGLSSLFGDEEKIAQELALRVTAIGLAPRIAIAANIETAIHAARGFSGVTIIPAGQERRRLGVLPVGVLTAQTETLEVLQRWGIDTLKALAALPVPKLSERLGQEGVRLNLLARGACERALVLAHPATQFVEEMELDDAVEELEPLSFVLGRLLDQLCARLEARALSIRAVHLLFELQPSFEKDFRPLKEEFRKKPETKHYSKVLSLPVPIRNPKTLLKLLRLQLQSNPPPAPMQKICMTADSAAPRVTQNGLFAPAGPDAEKLELTIARLTKLVGEGNVGAVHLDNSHRPESFHLERFSVANEQNTGRGTGHPCPRQSRATTALRIMRPPESIRVDLRDNQPARIYHRGTRGKVLSASGPWRTSGDWWQENPWHQDEWDLEVELALFSQRIGARDTRAHSVPHRALYRIFFDTLSQSWFLRGVYD